MLGEIYITPIHLLGFNVYNVPKSTISQRLLFLANTWPKTTLARFARNGTCYGVGGNSNRFLRGHIYRFVHKIYFKN